MKLFYVMGGGMGHLFRVQTFIRQFGLTNYKILTNNPRAHKLFPADEIILIKGETPDALKQQIQRQVSAPEFSEVYIDTFPAGLFGELTIREGVQTTYLARRLKWNNYEPLVGKAKLQFHTVICVEELEPGHAEWINSIADNILRVELQYPDPDPARIPKEFIDMDKSIWLIVHAFVREEVESLTNYAKEVARQEKRNPAFVVLTDQIVEDESIRYFTYFPAQDWFRLAERIFTGGGYNTLRQAKPFFEKVTAIPFPRKYDDQVWRVAQFKSARVPN
jgi:hypothetical protein